MENETRSTDWGHWSLKFFIARDSAHPRDAVKFVAELPFAVGAQGPIDGTLGSSMRRYYGECVRKWQIAGELPTGAICAVDQKWLYEIDKREAC